MSFEGDTGQGSRDSPGFMRKLDVHCMFHGTGGAYGALKPGDVRESLSSREGQDRPSHNALRLEVRAMDPRATSRG